MKVLDTPVKESVDNNLQLAAALEEVYRLNTLVERVKEILEIPHDVTFQVEESEPYTPTFDQLNDCKIDMLVTLIF